MRMFRCCGLAAMALLPALVLAHAHLEMSVPGANSVITVMPAKILLHFSEAITITALTIAPEGGDHAVKLKTASQPNILVEVPTPALKPGVYVLKWRGISDDHHVADGTVRFTLVDK